MYLWSVKVVAEESSISGNWFEKYTSGKMHQSCAVVYFSWKSKKTFYRLDTIQTKP